MKRGVRSFACKFPKKNVATRIKTAIRANDGFELREVPPDRVIMGEAQQTPKGEDHAVVVRQAGVGALLHLCRGGAEAPQKLPLGVKAALRGDRQLCRPPAAPVRHAVVRWVKKSDAAAHFVMPSTNFLMK